MIFLSTCSIIRKFVSCSLFLRVPFGYLTSTITWGCKKLRRMEALGSTPFFFVAFLFAFFFFSGCACGGGDGGGYSMIGRYLKFDNQTRFRIKNTRVGDSVWFWLWQIEHINQTISCASSLLHYLDDECVCVCEDEWVIILLIIKPESCCVRDLFVFARTITFWLVFFHQRLITVLFARILPKFKNLKFDFCLFTWYENKINCYCTEFILFFADSLQGWQLVCERINILTSVL